MYFLLFYGCRYVTPLFAFLPVGGVYMTYTATVSRIRYYTPCVSYSMWLRYSSTKKFFCYLFYKVCLSLRNFYPFLILLKFDMKMFNKKARNFCFFIKKNSWLHLFCKICQFERSVKNNCIGAGASCFGTMGIWRTLTQKLDHLFL